MSNISNSGIVTFDTSEAVVIDAAVTLPPVDNSALLFRGDYDRDGADLVISHEDHGALRIQNFFIQPDLPNLFSADGALIDGETAAQLAGPQAAGQYAQAGTGLAAAQIGSVQTLVGTATAQRTDGTVVTLSTGDPVFQGDVVQTATGSSLAIVFVDETLFSLSADARMVLDELIYTPGGADNSMVMNLVQGSFVFVTGQVAPSGDMRIETPTATMGIRGTTPIVQINAIDGSTRFSLSLDPSGILGSYQLFDRISGQLLGTVSTTDSTYLVPSVGATPIVTPKSQTDVDAEQGQVQQAFDAYRAAGLGQTNSNDDTDGDSGPDQTDSGPPEGIQTPEVVPLEPEGETNPDSSNPEESGLDLLNPSSPEGGASVQFASRSTTQTQISENIEEPPDDLTVVVPANVVIAEDQSINLTGLNIEIPGDGEGTVTIVARSTVTLAQIDGLTFITGDGFEDEEMSFSGSEEDINAALSGLQYTPSPDSTDGGLSITVDDGTETVEADVPITIEPVEDPPTAFDISLTVNEDGTVTAPFVGSDPDPGDTISLNSVSDPALGRVIVNEDGTFTFDTDGDFETLSANSTQQVTFEYTVIDSTGRVSTNSGLVTIAVTGVNDAPEIVADQPVGISEAANAAAQQLLQSGTVLVSDVDQGDSATVTFSVSGAPVWSGRNLDDISPDLAATLLSGFSLGAGGGAQSAGQAVDAGLGSAGQGEIGWFYDATADLDFLAEGDTITFSYLITVEDLAGETATEVVTFTITGTEDAPVITGNASGAVAEDGTLITSGVLTATDVDAIDTPVFTVQTGTPGTYGTFEVTSGGSWTYTLDNAAAQVLAGGEEITESFTVFATTEDGESVSQIVEIIVTGQEDGPIITGTATGDVEEDGEVLTTSGQLTVSDADANDDPTFTAQEGTPGTYGTFEVTVGGVWTYTLDNAAAQVLAGGEEFTESFTVFATTEDGESVSQVVEITVTGEEDGPVISGTATADVEEDGTQTATGQLSVSDADANDDPVFTEQTGTAGAYGSFDVTTGGAWTYTLDNLTAQELFGGEEVVETFIVVATTEVGESVSQIVEITVTGQEDGPIISGTATGDVEEDGTPTATGQLSVSDADANDDPVFTAQDGTAGTYGTFDVTVGGVWTYTLDNAAAQVLAGGEEFTEAFTVFATTEDGESVSQIVEITITGEEDGSIISGTATGDVEEDGTQQATGQLSVSDADANDDPVFTAQEGTEGTYGFFEVTTGGAWTYTLDNAAAQVLAGGEEITESFTVFATTEDGESVGQVVEITVTGQEDGPVISGVATGDVEEDGTPTATGQLSVSDADANDAPVFTTQEGATGAYGSFDVTIGGAWTYTLDNAAAQELFGGEEVTETFTVVATTTDGESVEQIVEITITGEEDGSIISGTVTGDVEEDGAQQASGQLTVSDADANDDPVFTAQDGTTGTYGTFDVTAGGVWTYTLDNAAAQVLAGGEEFTESFTVFAATEDGESVSQIVEITVTGQEDGPIITGTATGDVEEDGTQTAMGQLSVSDADANDDPVFTEQTGTAGAYGSFDVTTGGAWTYTLDNLTAQELFGGEEVVETFIVVATTEDGESVSQIVEITITGEEDGSIISGTATGDVEEDGTQTATGQLSVSDVDANDDPVFTAQEGTAGTYGFFEVTTGGAWTYTLDNAAAQVLAGGEEFTESFTVFATTEDGESVSQVVEITVTGQENGPIISGTATGDVEEDGAQTASGQLSVSDADANDDPVFTAQEGTPGTYGTFEVTTGGAWTYTLDNAAAQVLAGGEEFTETFTVFATTEDGESVSQVVEITVTGEEDGPVISGTATGDVEEDGAQQASGQLSVSDADANDDPVFTAQEGTAGTYGTFEVTVGGLWTYTLDNAAAQVLAGGEEFTETFMVFATTEDGESVSQIVEITITGEEDGSIISGTATGDVEEDGTQTATGQLSVSDVDANDDPVFTAQEGTAGTYGFFEVTTGGAWTYTLDNAAAQVLAGGEEFTESFTVFATTEDGESVSQVVEITVTGEEDGPVISGVATGDVGEDGEVLTTSGQLTVSDADANDDPTFIAQEGTPGTYGTFEVTVGGLWTYTLDNTAAQVLAGGEDFTESFTVFATTEDGESVSQVVEITVTGEEDGPVISGTATGDVEEDGAQQASGQLTVSDADANDDPTFTAQEGTPGTYGTFEVTVGGLWTYTLDNAAAQVLAGGEDFTESFTVFATTEDGESVSQVVEITVTGEEDGPVISGTATGDVEEDGAQQASGQLTVSDADANDDPVFTAQDATAGTYGTFDVTVGGVWTYTLDNATAQVLAGGEDFTESFTVFATTEDGESVSQVVEIIVTGQEDGPIITGTVTGDVEEDGEVLTTSGQLSVSDADANDDPTFTTQEGTPGTYGTFDVTVGGLWTYTLDNAAAQVLSGGEEFTESFTVFATTEDGESVSQVVEITVTGQENGPIISGTATGDVEEDGAQTASGQLSVSDADANDDPVFTAQEGTPGTYGTFEVTTGGAWTYTLDNAAAQVLAGGEEFTETFTVFAITEDGESVSQIVEITVTGQEDGPIISGTATGDVAEDGAQTTTGQLSVSDADAEDTPVFVAQTGTEGIFGTFAVTTGGVWTYTLDNAAAQVLAAGETATETFTVVVQTGDGETVSQVVTIQIIGNEDGPQITGDTGGEVSEDGVLNATGTLVATDADGGDAPTFIVQEGTESALGVFTLSASGVWEYELDNAAAQALAGGQVVEDVFTVTAMTEDEESISQTVTIVVTGQEDAPVITGTSSGAVAEDGTSGTTGALTVTDADENDDPSFTAQPGTAGLYGTFVVTTAGVWTYTLNNALAQALAGSDIATETFEVEAKTADGETVTQTVTISVAGEEDAPVITGIANGAVFEDEVFSASGTLSVTDADANDDPSFTAQSGVEGAFGIFSIDANGNWTYALDNDAAQALERDETVTETFTVQASTADGESLSQVISVTVTGTNEAPAVPDVVLVATLTNNSGFENGFLDWQQIAGPQVGPNGEYIANSYNYSFVLDESGELIDGDNFVVDISFSGWLDQWNDGPNRGTVYGPSLLSNEFVGYAGDIVTFVYRPFAGGDAASISAVLINVDTGERTLVFFEETPVGGSSATKFIDVPISEEGTFQIEFIVGSFDATDGGFVGARLVIGTAGIIREGVLEGEFQTFEPIQFLGNATDPEGDTLSISNVQTFSAGGAAVSIDEDGNIHYETGSAFDYLNAGQTVTDTFTFTVSDGNGGFTTATASIDVVGVGSGAEGEALAYAPVANQSVRSAGNSAPVPIETTGTALNVVEPLPTTAVTYSFLPGGQAGSGLTAYAAAQQAAAVAALALWAEISGLTIAEAGEGESAAIRFLNSTSESYAATFHSSNGSTIVTNPDYLESQVPESGSYGFLTLLHETGHALGLEHAEGDLTHAQTVMSWHSPDILGVDWYNSEGIWIYAQTPMIEDIAAIQASYGSSPVTRAGDTVYGFNGTEAGTLYDFSANSDPVLTIYDAGGVDALDFSGWDAPALINLNPGSYSSVNGMTNNVGIAFGTIIEKAIGGAGDDVLIGTDRAETLDGGAGRDTLTGGGDADTFVIAHSDLADVIVDFEAGVDRLDLQALLAANFGEEDLEDYIQVTRDGADVVVQVDEDGARKTSDFKDVAVLQSVEAGGIIDFVFSDNGVQNTDTVVA